MFEVRLYCAGKCGKDVTDWLPEKWIADGWTYCSRECWAARAAVDPAAIRAQLGTFRDDVNHPSHYASGKIEVIEAIEDWGLNFHRGNAVKYTARAGKKDPAKEIQDLEKAIWYLRREVAVLKGNPPRPNDMDK